MRQQSPWLGTCQLCVGMHALFGRIGTTMTHAVMVVCCATCVFGRSRDFAHCRGQDRRGFVDGAAWHLHDGAGDDALPLRPLAALHRVRLARARLAVAEQAHLRAAKPGRLSD